jgi:cytochrome c biogenesis protein CcdA
MRLVVPVAGALTRLNIGAVGSFSVVCATTGETAITMHSGKDASRRLRGIICICLGFSFFAVFQNMCKKTSFTVELSPNGDQSP